MATPPRRPVAGGIATTHQRGELVSPTCHRHDAPSHEHARSSGASCRRSLHGRHDSCRKSEPRRQQGRSVVRGDARDPREQAAGGKYTAISAAGLEAAATVGCGHPTKPGRQAARRGCERKRIKRCNRANRRSGATPNSPMRRAAVTHGPQPSAVNHQRQRCQKNSSHGSSVPLTSDDEQQRRAQAGRKSNDEDALRPLPSCPAPFERLEVGRTASQPRCRTSPVAAMKIPVPPHAARRTYFLYRSRKATDRGNGALDRAGELALLLGRHGGDAARHDLAALGNVTRQQTWILVVDLRRVRTRKRAGLATTERTDGGDLLRPSIRTSLRAGLRHAGAAPRSPRSGRLRDRHGNHPVATERPPPRSSRSRSRSRLRIMAEGPSSSASTRTVRSAESRPR